MVTKNPDAQPQLGTRIKPDKTKIAKLVSHAINIGILMNKRGEVYLASVHLFTLKVPSQLAGPCLLLYQAVIRRVGGTWLELPGQPRLGNRTSKQLRIPAVHLSRFRQHYLFPLFRFLVHKGRT
jgi:hypothetical protein